MTDFDTCFTEIQDAPGEIFDMDFDDRWDADDFDRRRMERDGWGTVCWDGR
jgi:hypothetical protein